MASGVNAQIGQIFPDAVPAVPGASAGEGDGFAQMLTGLSAPGATPTTVTPPAGTMASAIALTAAAKTVDAIGEALPASLAADAEAMPAEPSATELEPGVREMMARLLHIDRIFGRGAKDPKAVEQKNEPAESDGKEEGAEDGKPKLAAVLVEAGDLLAPAAMATDPQAAQAAQPPIASCGLIVDEPIELVPHKTRPVEDGETLLKAAPAILPKPTAVPAETAAPAVTTATAPAQAEPVKAAPVALRSAVPGEVAPAAVQPKSEPKAVGRSSAPAADTIIEAEAVKPVDLGELAPLARPVPLPEAVRGAIEQETVAVAAPSLSLAALAAGANRTPPAVSGQTPKAPAADEPSAAAAPIAPAAPFNAAVLQSLIQPQLAVETPSAPAPTAHAEVAADAAEQAIERQLDIAQDDQWIDQIARDIARTAGREGPLRFRLHPESLGALQIEVSQSQAGTSVRMTADTEAARSIIADAQPRLLAEARAQGVRIAETHVGLNGGGQHEQRRHEDGRQEGFLRTAATAEAEADQPDEDSAASAERFA